MGKSLKAYLRGAIQDDINSYTKALDRARTSSKEIGDINTRNANFHVRLHSLWSSHGEKGLNRHYNGSLQGAIESAEKDFKELNGRQDVQASVSVSMVIGAEEYSIPESFWERYQGKN